MIKFLFFMFFIIPLGLINIFYLVQGLIFILVLILIFEGVNSGFSLISYFLGMDILSFGLVFLTF
jgi:hypothetical protein